MKKIKLSIPKPCHESWQEMSPREQGRYCKSCEITVLDFSKKSDKEIFSFFTDHRGSTCGKFHSTQLERNIVKHPARNQSILKIAAIAAGLFTSTASIAQTNVPNSGTPLIENQMSIASSKIHTEAEKIMLNGMVLDEHEKNPIIFANVTIEDKLGNILVGTTTDFDGKFSFDASKYANPENTLNVTYIGYTKYSAQLMHHPNKVNILLQEDVRLGEIASIVGLVVYETPAQKTKRTIRGIWRSTINFIKDLDWTWKRQNSVSNIQSEKQNKTLDNAQAFEVSISPNPASNYIEIRLHNQPAEDLKIHIFSNSGQFIDSFKIDQKELIIPITNYADESYYISFIDSKHKVLHTEKIMVIKPSE